MIKNITFLAYDNSNVKERWQKKSWQTLPVDLDQLGETARQIAELITTTNRRDDHSFVQIELPYCEYDMFRAARHSEEYIARAVQFFGHEHMNEKYTEWVCWICLGRDQTPEEYLQSYALMIDNRGARLVRGLHKECL